MPSLNAMRQIEPGDQATSTAPGLSNRQLAEQAAREAEAKAKAAPKQTVFVPSVYTRKSDEPTKPVGVARPPASPKRAKTREDWYKFFQEEYMASLYIAGVDFSTSAETTVGIINKRADSVIFDDLQSVNDAVTRICNTKITGPSTGRISSKLDIPVKRLIKPQVAADEALEKALKIAAKSGMRPNGIRWTPHNPAVDPKPENARVTILRNGEIHYKDKGCWVGCWDLGGSYLCGADYEVVGWQ